MVAKHKGNQRESDDGDVVLYVLREKSTGLYVSTPQSVDTIDRAIFFTDAEEAEKVRLLYGNGKPSEEEVVSVRLQIGEAA